MNRITKLVALACVLSPAFAHRVRVDFNHGTHFSYYKTYRWVPSADPAAKGALFPNQLMQERIVAFVDQALAARGFKRVTTGGDLLVCYRMNVTEQPVFNTFSSGWGPGWGWGWGPGWGSGWGGWGWQSGFSTTTVQINYEGTLVVNMVDAKQNQLVFQGTSTQAVSSRPQRNTKKLAKAVNEIFERYPSGS